jgi:hypothetical protein
MLDENSLVRVISSIWLQSASELGSGKNTV